jgi:uncharacterized membrane protein
MHRSYLKLAPKTLCFKCVVSHGNFLHSGIVELEPAVLVGIDGCVSLPFLEFKIINIK